MKGVLKNKVMGKAIINLFLTFTLFNICSFVSYGQTTDSTQLWNNTFTFSQSLNRISKQNNNGMKITFSNIDTINHVVDINLNFHFSKKAISIFQQDLNKNDTASITNLLSHKKNKNIYNTTLYLKDVMLNWDIEKNLFFSTDTLLIYELNKNIINKKVIGKIEIHSIILSASFNFFIKTENSKSYYFYYNNNILSVLSSNPIYNEIITRTRPNRRYINSKKGLSSYSYYISSEHQLKNFLNRIEHQDWF